jgi:hypothetical protein
LTHEAQLRVNDERERNGSAFSYQLPEGFDRHGPSVLREPASVNPCLVVLDGLEDRRGSIYPVPA